MNEKHWEEQFDIYQEEFLKRKESTVMIDSSNKCIVAFNINIDLNDFPAPD